MAVEDTQEEREKRAERLRKQIEDMKKGLPLESSEVKNPRDFINEKMREEQEDKDQSGSYEEQDEQSDDCEQ
jgi:hypothetical protein